MKKQVTILLAFACALVPGRRQWLRPWRRTSRSRLKRPRQPTSQPDAPEAGPPAIECSAPIGAGDESSSTSASGGAAISWSPPASRSARRPHRAAELDPPHAEALLSLPAHARGQCDAVPLQGGADPDWGRQHLRSIAWCESSDDPRAIGGGGAYRGMYQFSFSTWAGRRRQRRPRGCAQVRADLARVAAAEPPRRRPLAGLRLGHQVDLTRAGPAGVERAGGPRRV